MFEALRPLLALCDLDSEAHTLRQQLARYPALLADLAAREAAAKKRIETAKAAHAHARETRRKAELEVKSLREQIQKYLVHQQQARTNKEFDAIKHEIEDVRVKIDAAETLGLESLEAEERTDAEIKAATAALDALGKELKSEHERIAGQSAEKQTHLTEGGIERARLLASLPDRLQEEYVLLNQSFPGTALAPLREGCCGGCNFKLVMQRIQEVRRGTDFIHCENCRRFLYDSESTHGKA